MRPFVILAAWTILTGTTVTWGEPGTQPATQPSTQPAGEQPSAEVLSLQVNRPLPPELQAAAGNVRRQGFNQAAPGVAAGEIELLVAIHVPRSTILSAGEDALRLSKFVDSPPHSPGGIGIGALGSPCACEFGPFGCQASCCASLCNLS